MSTEFCAHKIFVPFVFTAGRSSEAVVQNLARVSRPTSPHLFQGPSPVRGWSRLPALIVPPGHLNPPEFVTSALPRAVLMSLFLSLPSAVTVPRASRQGAGTSLLTPAGFEGVHNALQTIFSLLLF